MYSQAADRGHLKKYGQYFTDYAVAEFMCAWACERAKNMLDPAVGNSVFFTRVRERYPDCRLTGYELDETILDYFGNPAHAKIIRGDYLAGEWDCRYDAIVCNPPYHRFQAVPDRDRILDRICENTGVRYSGYTNLYILFLVKSICQLSDCGRLAYIIPTEFLNSKYGTQVKRLLLERRLVRAIIHFSDNERMFFNATTTCCILLADKRPKQCVRFYSLASAKDLQTLNIEGEDDLGCVVSYEELTADEKWRCYVNHEERQTFHNLRSVSDFCRVSRGIATGANDFFCFSKEKARAYGIPKNCLTKCVCRSADVRSIVFTEEDFKNLADKGRQVYVLDITALSDSNVEKYIRTGEQAGIDRRYLPSARHPWYSMEQKQAAPIWVSSACRGGVKFVRNLAGIKSLTTFHSVFVKEDFKEDTDLIFCYFLTQTAQKILLENRKELGNGLIKFQPNDLNTARMLDITRISLRDRERMLGIYRDMAREYPKECACRLNEIVEGYV